MFSASDEWVVFDPYDLEFYSMNTIAAEIFFLISQGKSDAEAYLLLAQKYEMSFEQFKIFKSTLIECSPFYKAIFVNDLINNS